MLLAGMMSGAALAQDVGRVILSVGEVTLVREGRSTPLNIGAEIRSGDRVVTGQTSNAQIRFTDTGIVALRPETDFSVDEYNFRGQQDGSERALFSLLKGGMRTVTGLVGKLNQQNYRVRTPTATIGIRGTHFNLVQCDDNCKNSDGGTAPNGTYGGVSDGRVAVAPLNAPTATPPAVAVGDEIRPSLLMASSAGRADVPAERGMGEVAGSSGPLMLAQLNGPPGGGGGAAERVFGAGEFFRVPDANTPAVQLLAPPGFLTDRLEGQLRAGQRQSGTGTAASSGGGSSSSTTATSTSSSTTVDARATTAPPAIEPIQYVSTETKTGTGGNSVLVTGVTGFIAQYATGNSSFEVIDDCGGGSNCSSTAASTFTFSNNTPISYSNSSGTLKGTFTGASVVDAGTATIAGAQYGWGRLTGGTLVTSSGQTLTSPPSGVLFGFTNDPTVGNNHNTTLPSSGTVSYVLVGGPNPVDTAGNVGSITSMSGSVNFTTRNVNMSMGLSLTVPGQGTASMSLSGGGVIPSSSDLKGASMSGSCTGSACISTSASGNFDARFGGTAAQVMVLNGGVNSVVKDQTQGSALSRSILFLNLLKCSTC
jgi:hypothetical protein